MPGMSTGLSTNNPNIVSAFQSTLLHQGLVVLLILAVVATAWNLLRSVQLRQAKAMAGRHLHAPGAALFSGARRPTVAAGLVRPPLDLRRPAPGPAVDASGHGVTGDRTGRFDVARVGPAPGQCHGDDLELSPHRRPGLGCVDPNWPGRMAAGGVEGHVVAAGGVASVGWGVIVWIFGEAFGQVFSPGQSWMFGLPGAVLFYCAAGVLIALPESAWDTPRLGRWILRAIGLFWLGMALLQAWPGRGFWQGRPTKHASPGSLTTMVQQMATTPQPHLLSSWVAAFANFDAAHGWGVNLFVVVALAVIGSLFITARPRLVLVGVVAGTVLCLADWVLVEDLGFMGGVGTDPNSMVPMTLVFIAGYLAITRAPAVVKDSSVVPITAVAVPGRERLNVGSRLGRPDVYVPLGCRPRRHRGHPGRGRAHVGGGRQPARRPHLGPGHRRHPGYFRQPCPFFQPGRPVREARIARQLAWQDRRPHLPGRHVHSRLPGDRSGVPRCRPLPWVRRPPGGDGWHQRQPPLHNARTTWPPSTAKKGSKMSPTGGTSRARYRSCAGSGPPTAKPSSRYPQGR